MTRSRAFCFTRNNYADVDEGYVARLPCIYSIYGHEVGASGTPHLQGYVYFKHARTHGSVRKMLPGFHIEIAKGSAADNEKYCSKEADKIVVFGERPMSPEQKGEMEQDRWDSARESARLGLYDEVPSDLLIRYHGGLRFVRQAHLETLALESNDQLMNEWYWGQSGSGKSRTARDRYPDAYLKMKNKWWNGYQGEDVVIIDDIDPSHEHKFGAMLKEWADHYPFQSEVKNGTMVIRPKKIVVTSQYQIGEIFRDLQTVDALKRRFHVTRFTEYSPMEDVEQVILPEFPEFAVPDEVIGLAGYLPPQLYMYGDEEL